MTRTSGDRWTLVVPVKHTRFGKSRLTPYIGRHRPELAHAMTLDTVAAALTSATVEEIVAVTNDPAVARDLELMGVVVVADEPDDGLNPAVVHGALIARARRPGRPVAAMSSDLPALRPLELERVLDAAREHRTSFVPDATGSGTTLYGVRADGSFTPRFGIGSRSAHRSSGAVEIDLPDIVSVRRDVDEEADLDEAVGLGIGPRTREVLASLGAVV